MKKIILLSFAFLFFATCDDNSVTNDDTGITWASWYGGATANLTISVGDVVLWTNSASATHTVTSSVSGTEEEGAIFSSGNILSGGAFEYQFDTAGTFLYNCTIHTSMTGIIIVVE